MDTRLRGRIDAADVVQEAFVAASANCEVYFRERSVPLFLWLRGIVSNKLLELHRHHLGARMRDAKRERTIEAPRAWDDTTAVLCAHLTGHLTSPSMAVRRDEIKTRLAAALDKMDATDREVLTLRHFEQLTNAEAAQVVGIQERAAAKRYLRALERLKRILSDLPGGLSELRP
jgi:RNA polymerase sigma-70 factor (ECF subfamily)